MPCHPGGEVPTGDREFPQGDGHLIVEPTKKPISEGRRRLIPADQALKHRTRMAWFQTGRGLTAHTLIGRRVSRHLESDGWLAFKALHD